MLTKRAPAIVRHFCIYWCRWFDISFNRLTQIKNLSHLVGLKSVFLCANRITQIENLDQLTNLTTLELGDNRIRVRKS